jgi:hypothetical protein
MRHAEIAMRHAEIAMRHAESASGDNGCSRCNRVDYDQGIAM